MFSLSSGKSLYPQWRLLCRGPDGWSGGPERLGDFQYIVVAYPPRSAELLHESGNLHDPSNRVLTMHRMSVVPQPQDDQAVVAHGRVFARFSLQHVVYCVPVDEVSDHRAECPKTSFVGRKSVVPSLTG